MNTYDYYRQILKGQSYPLAFVDLDLFDKNIQAIHQRAQGKKIRLASKSIRCLELINRVLAHPDFEGVMCYSAKEAVFLSKNGLDDLLIAYPTWQEKDIASACQQIQQGKTITFMVDNAEHLQQLAQVAQNSQTRIPVCIDIDLSSNFGPLYFGVYRSSIRNETQALKLAQQIQQNEHLFLHGLMGYEAQIAGLGDYNPSNNFVINAVIKVLKKISCQQIQRRRGDIVKTLTQNGINFSFVNGGGTGSIETTRQEDWVTEIAVGSGFYASGLFDYYNNFQHLPAAAYAIEIVRQPQKGFYTCHGGGYVASGGCGKDKLPVVYLPEKAQLDSNEGAGEVQTPIRYTGSQNLQHGDPIFLRHSKAGELCEHFQKLLLIQDGKIIQEVPTYRGQGHCFL